MGNGVNKPLSCGPNSVAVVVMPTTKRAANSIRRTVSHGRGLTVVSLACCFGSVLSTAIRHANTKKNATMRGNELCCNTNVSKKNTHQPLKMQNNQLKRNDNQV